MIGLRDEVDDHWQIPRDEAMVLAQLVRIGRCRSICEIGTSYGFSTLHLAAAASEHGGRVHSIDADPKKVKAAGESMKEAGLAEVVTLHEGDARAVLAGLKPQPPFDFVFIDATKDRATSTWTQSGQTCSRLRAGDRQYGHARRGTRPVRGPPAQLARIHQLRRDRRQRVRADRATTLSDGIGLVA